MAVCWLSRIGWACGASTRIGLVTRHCTSHLEGTDCNLNSIRTFRDTSQVFNLPASWYGEVGSRRWAELWPATPDYSVEPLSTHANPRAPASDLRRHPFSTTKAWLNFNGQGRLRNLPLGSGWLYSSLLFQSELRLRFDWQSLTRSDFENWRQASYYVVICYSEQHKSRRCPMAIVLSTALPVLHSLETPQGFVCFWSGLLTEASSIESAIGFQVSQCYDLYIVLDSRDIYPRQKALS